MTAFRSQTDEQLAAKWDREPYVTPEGVRRSQVWFDNSEPAAVVGAAFLPRVECIPSRDPYPVSGKQDPDPRITPNRYGALDSLSKYGMNHDTLRWAPRPEFARPPVNRILEAFRDWALSQHCDLQSAAEYWSLSVDSFDAFGGMTEWDAPGHPFRSFTIGTSDEIAHARRVLARLAAL